MKTSDCVICKENSRRGAVCSFSTQQTHGSDRILVILMDYFTGLYGYLERHLLGIISSVAKPCLTLCDPMDCSMPGFPILHHFPEFAQTHTHWVSVAIQPSHFLSPPSSLALNLHYIWIKGIFNFFKKIRPIWGVELKDVAWFNSDLPFQFPSYQMVALLWFFSIVSWHASPSTE